MYVKTEVWNECSKLSLDASVSDSGPIYYCAHVAHPIFPTVLFSSLMSEGQSSSSVVPQDLTSKNLVY